MAGLAAILVLVVGPAVSLADTGTVVDCAPPLPIEKAVFSDLVFVGKVTDVANGGRSATVEVTDVWRGDVATPVTVFGGADPTNPAEDDRVFEVGVTYLFVPSQFDALRQGIVVDSVCSSTTPWRDDLRSLRPADAHAPAPAELGTGSANPLAFLGGILEPAITAAIVGGGAFLVALVVARRREA